MSIRSHSTLRMGVVAVYVCPIIKGSELDETWVGRTHRELPTSTSMSHPEIEPMVDVLHDMEQDHIQALWIPKSHAALCVQ